MRRIGLIAAFAVCIGLIAAPANAAPELVGFQLNLLAPGCLTGADPASQPADTEFHVAHGFGLDPGTETAVGHWKFDLWVDGVKQHRYVEIAVLPGGNMSRRYVSSFPDGLSAGVHEIRAVWTDPDGVSVGPFGPLDCTWDVAFN